MNLEKKLNRKIAAFIVLCFGLAAIGYLLYPREHTGPDYIFDSSYNITLDDVNQAHRVLRPPKQNDDKKGASGDNEQEDKKFNEKIWDLFSEGLINTHTTLRYFKFLSYKFRKAKNMAEHLEMVKAYLDKHFPPKEAQILFDTYQKYLQCEIDLADEYKNFGTATTTEEALAILKRIQDFRRQRLGTELADKLFGAEVKAKEYALRRAQIILRDDLYGEEKEALIAKLNQDMWGDEADKVEKHPNPYNRYQEKLKIYQKDLAELPSEEEKKAKIDEFRKEFFPPEVVAKFDEIDKQVEQEKQKEEDYKSREAAILEDQNLSQEEKQQEIQKLQDEMFGKDADAFRRRLAIERGREEFIKSHQKKE